MNNPRETFGAQIAEWIARAEPALYLAAFALALALRWVNLGAPPLGDAEASWALQALHLARPAPSAALPPGPNPGYIVATGLSFWLLGATDFLARAWPALSGALLVWAAYLFRKDLGAAAALILAFGLALDPGLVAVSRQAGGPMPAAAFTLLAFGLWRARRPAPAGILGGLALLSGPGILPGVAGLALAAWAAGATARRLEQRDTRRQLAGDPTAGWDAPRPGAPAPGEHGAARRALIAAGVTLLLAGTAFLRFPQGLPAFFASLIGYLQAWSAAPQAGPALLLLALAAFELLPLIFALIHLGRVAIEWEDRQEEDLALTVFAGVWALAALILALAYPARQTADLIWVILPLWVLAARELAHYIPDERPHVMVSLQAVMIVVLASLFWITLTTTPVVVQPEVPWETLRLVILAGIFVLAVLTSALVALGWSWPISRDGSAWGGLLALGVYSVAAMWGASQLRPGQPHELWGQGPGPGQARLLVETIDDLSTWGRGLVNEIEVVSRVDAASLRWALRDYQHTRFSAEAGSGPAAGALPAIVITAGQEQPPELAAGYRGQDFAWWTRPGWQGALPPNLKEWLTYRRSPLAYDYIILWARGDLFPGADAGSTGANPAP